MIEKTTPLVFLHGYKLEKTYIDITHKHTVNDKPNPPPIGWHFGYARAITLGGYFIVSPLVGMLPQSTSTVTANIVQCDTEMNFYHGLVLAMLLADLFSAVQAYRDIHKRVKEDQVLQQFGYDETAEAL